MIKGSKGGSSKRKAVESPDSLFSIATARVIDLVSEGEIQGFPHGDDFLRDVYFDETPVQNPDGSRNFRNFQIDARMGTQDQSHIPGFAAVENEIGVGIELKADAPWTRSFSNRDLSAVRVRLGVPALSHTNDENGDIKGTTVRYAIDISTDGGPFQTAVTSAFTGKTSSGYERGHRIDLPPSEVSGWVLRVRRLTPDSTSAYLQNKTSVVSVTEIIDGKFRYPMSAVVGSQIDSSQFQSIPVRAYHLLGRIIRVPTNYDPVNRTYATSGPGTSNGAWDGTFKTAYSNNPAWVYYDLVTHPRYGLGHLVDQLVIDKWSLYGIAQYCDELVEDGFGGLEPRFTCNLYLQRAADAWRVLGDLTSVFRGICYWAGGSIVPVADRPSSPVYTYTNANVVEGTFAYQSTSRRARHTAVMVSYNDMTNMGQLATDYYDDPEGIARFGYQLAEVQAIGCTSRGQAQRFARWILWTEKLLTNLVTFSVGPDGTFANPGQIVRIADKHRAGRRIGGRIAAATASVITPDRMPDPAPMPGDTLVALLPNGTTQSRTVSAVVGGNIHVSQPYSEVPVVQGAWAVESNDLSTQLFRVLSVEDNDDGSFTLTAMQHNPSVFDAVDFGEAIQIPNVRDVPSNTQQKPNSVSITAAERAGKVVAMPLLTATWDAPPGAVRYQIQWRKDDGEWSAVQEVTGTTSDYEAPFEGWYEAKVSAVNALGIVSPPTISDKFLLGDQELKPGVIVEIEEDLDVTRQVYEDLLIDFSNWKTRVETVEQEADAIAQDLIDKADELRGEIDDEIGRAQQAEADLHALAAALRADIDANAAQISEILGAADWSDTVAWEQGSIVKHDGKIYKAKQAVPVGTAITNTTYWELMGEYASLGDMVAAHAAQLATHADELQAHAHKLDLLGATNGASTAFILNLNTVRVTANETMAQWRQSIQSQFGSVNSRIDDEVQALSDADSALATRTQTMEARMPSGTDKLVNTATLTAVENASVTRDNALADRALAMESRMPTGTDKLVNTATLTQTQQTLANATSAVASDLALLGAKTANGQSFQLNNSKVLVDVNQSLAQWRQSLQTTFGEHSSRMDTMTQTQANDHSATVSRLEAMEASTGGTNLLENSDFSTGDLESWNIANPGGAVNTAYLLSVGSDWSFNDPAGVSRTLELKQSTGDSTANYIEVWQTFAVDANKVYQISAYTGAHRCMGRIFAYFYRADWSSIGNTYTTSADILAEDKDNNNQKKGGGLLKDYKQIWQTVKIPSDAAFLRLSIRKHATSANASEPNSYLFVTRVQAVEVPATNNGPVAWTPSASSLGAKVKGHTQAIDSINLAIDQGDDFAQAIADDVELIETAINHPSTGLASKASVGQFNTLKGRMDNTGNGRSIEQVASALTNVENALPGKASTNALNILDTYTRQTLKGEVEANASAITSVRAGLTGGGNLMGGTTFTGDVFAPGGVYFSGSVPGGSRTAHVNNAGASWRVGDLNNIGWHVPGQTTAGQYADFYTNQPTLRAAVGADKWYIASVYAGSHRSNVGMYLRFMDRNGNILATPSSPARTGHSGGPLDDNERIFVRAKAPAGAAYTYLILRHFMTGEVDAYSWFTAPMIEQVSEEQLTPSPWSPGGNEHAHVTQVMEANVNSLTGTVQGIYGFSVSAGGKVTGMKAVASGTESVIDFMADAIRISSAGSGERMELSNSNLRVYDSSNRLRVRLGIW